MSEHHKMTVIETRGNEDTLFCPTCGRTIIITWPPNYSKRVLYPGDEYAIHSGGKGGLEIGPPQVGQADDDWRVQVFEDYLKGL